MNECLERERKEIYERVAQVVYFVTPCFDTKETFMEFISICGGWLFEGLSEEAEKLFWLYPISKWFEGYEHDYVYYDPEADCSDFVDKCVKEMTFLNIDLGEYLEFKEYVCVKEQFAKRLENEEFRRSLR